VYEVSQALPDVPIVGIGGVVDARSAIEFLLAGATAVAVGTANYFDPHATIGIAGGIREFLAARGMSSPDDLRGRLVTPSRPQEPAYQGG
jgi:dihydroorotate dehydrogenase (NAD+) catalytic subunit